MTANEILNEVVENAVRSDEPQIFIVASETIGHWEQYRRLDYNGDSINETVLSVDDFHAGELLIDAGAQLITAVRGYFRREECVASLWAYSFNWNADAKKGLVAALKNRFADDLQDGDSELSEESAKSLRETLTETLEREKRYDGYICSQTFTPFLLYADDKNFGRILCMTETLQYLLETVRDVAVRSHKNITIRLEQDHETGAWFRSENVEITPETSRIDLFAVMERFNSNFKRYPVVVSCKSYENAN